MSNVRKLLRPALACRARQCHDGATQPEAASNDVSLLARERAPAMVAEVLVVIEIILDALIQSTSAKAAISMDPLADRTAHQRNRPNHGPGIAERQRPPR